MNELVIAYIEAEIKKLEQERVAVAQRAQGQIDLISALIEAKKKELENGRPTQP